MIDKDGSIRANYLIFQRGGSTTQIETRKVPTDAAARFAEFMDGKHSWGGGSSAVDTHLYRSAAGVLRTDGKLLADRYQVQVLLPPVGCC